jgi:hypothetical protein
MSLITAGMAVFAVICLFPAFWINEKGKDAVNASLLKGGNKP